MILEISVDLLFVHLDTHTFVVKFHELLFQFCLYLYTFSHDDSNKNLMCFIFSRVDGEMTFVPDQQMLHSVIEALGGTDEKLLQAKL